MSIPKACRGQVVENAGLIRPVEASLTLVANISVFNEMEIED